MQPVHREVACLDAFAVNKAVGNKCLFSEIRGV